MNGGPVRAYNVILNGNIVEKEDLVEGKTCGFQEVSVKLL
jgi:hypothetical protein